MTNNFAFPENRVTSFSSPVSVAASTIYEHLEVVQLLLSCRSGSVLVSMESLRRSLDSKIGLAFSLDSTRNVANVTIVLAAEPKIGAGCFG